jgi:hypothetical protein
MWFVFRRVADDADKILRQYDEVERLFGEMNEGRKVELAACKRAATLSGYDEVLLDGTPYENKEACWHRLSEASKDARYLQLVPIDGFVDRRNAEAIVYRRENTGRSFVWVYGSNIQDMPLGQPEPPSALLNERQPPQRFQIELWAEKTTMNDILEPLAQRYAATLVTGAGGAPSPIGARGDIACTD